ncbi:unnamed protein product [Rotaria sp. Silwood2]|nr:unnamed protein product [Rotaria sp. Silwood2]
MTSHSLPDQYTGMTGTARAFQLLNSAGCWSDQLFDVLSLNILSQITAISPKATYYPEDLTCMVTIKWNLNSLPYSMQHFGYYLTAKKLIDLFLIIRGLLSSEVLLVALKKRYRVNYGINPNSYFNRLMAVPFRAKDIIADKTEFGRPDVALVLTQLSYYYSGLNDSQLIQCFVRLSKTESNPASTYEQWIPAEEQDGVPLSIKQWKGVNLKDYQQQTQDIFSTLRYNMLVVNYFLNHFVFPREAKQFPHKLVSSALDLSSSLRSKITTGFSGTNDTQLLFPVHIQQYDLLELQKTDAIVVNNFLQPESESYQSLPINATSNEILDQIIAYAVYLEFDSIVACDRQFHHQRLDHCIFYLDEIHMRGIDFKFPNEFKAVVTLENSLTKDRFVQVAMRMRKLGNGHSLIFWSSNEVHQQSITLKKDSFHQNQEENVNHLINLIDILRWVYNNTMQSTWEGLHHWSAQSLSFQQKMSASLTIIWKNDQQWFTDIMMKELARECLEPETTELTHMDDEEQQRVLEQELEEEQQLRRSSSVIPWEPRLHEEIKKLCDTYGAMLDLAQFPNVFRHLAYAFIDTTFSSDGESLNSFMRPPRWIVVYRHQHRLLLPRTKRIQSIFANTYTLTIPPLIAPSDDAAFYFIPIEQLVQLHVFNGTLYFETVAEQTAYCHCLSLCSKPRTDTQEKAFEENRITIGGFVGKPEHRCHLQIHQARFNLNPLAFVTQLIKNRNNSDTSIPSHVGSIILNSHKLIQDREQESSTRVAIVNNDRYKPKKGNPECKRSCSVNKTGKLCIEVTPVSNNSHISEELCIGCGICVEKCPFDVTTIINLPTNLDKETAHRYGPNSFKLYRLRTPRPGHVLGLVRSNGTGKTTASQILSGKLKPNLGKYSILKTKRNSFSFNVIH